MTSWLQQLFDLQRLFAVDQTNCDSCQNSVVVVVVVAAILLAEPQSPAFVAGYSRMPLPSLSAVVGLAAVDLGDAALVHS